jgi:hypothetical protein
MNLAAGRVARSKQSDHQTKHPYGAETNGEIGEYNRLVVLEDLSEQSVHSKEEETTTNVRDCSIQP